MAIMMIIIVVILQHLNDHTRHVITHFEHDVLNLMIMPTYLIIARLCVLYDWYTIDTTNAQIAVVSWNRMIYGWLMKRVL